jgi:hypothetical protein
VTGEVTPAPELTARLLALAAEGPVPAPAPRREQHRSVVPLGESAYAVPAKALSGDLLAGRRSPARLLTGALTGAGVVVASLLVLGEQPVVVPSTHPAEALTVLSRAPQHAPVRQGVAERQLMATVATTGGAAAAAEAAAVAGDSRDAAVLAWMRAEGWSCPDHLPTGYSVTAVRVGGEDGEVLEVDLTGPYGRVVLTEQRGRLDVAALGPVEERTIGGRTPHVVSRHP